jgi:hypothetical protein
MLLQILLQLWSNKGLVSAWKNWWLEYVIPCVQGFETDTELKNEKYLKLRFYIFRSC